MHLALLVLLSVVAAVVLFPFLVRLLRLVILLAQEWWGSRFDD